MLQLLFNLAESELDEINCNGFFDILNDLVVQQGQQQHQQQQEGQTATMADKLVSLYDARGDLFSSKQRFQLQTWFLLYSVKNSLLCDDSFRFCRACQVVSELFQVMFPAIVTADYSEDAKKKDNEEDKDEGEEDKEPSAALKRDRTAATLVCLAAALPLYSRTLWAKQPLDKLFAAVAQHRLLLPSDQREQLDELTTAITLTRRKAVSGKPAQTVRAFNSTAHPLKTKKVGLLR